MSVLNTIHPFLLPVILNTINIGTVYILDSIRLDSDTLSDNRYTADRDSLLSFEYRVDSTSILSSNGYYFVRTNNESEYENGV